MIKIQKTYRKHKYYKEVKNVFLCVNYVVSLKLWSEIKNIMCWAVELNWTEHISDRTRQGWTSKFTGQVRLDRTKAGQVRWLQSATRKVWLVWKKVGAVGQMNVMIPELTIMSSEIATLYIINGKMKLPWAEYPVLHIGCGQIFWLYKVAKLLVLVIVNVNGTLCWQNFWWKNPYGL